MYISGRMISPVPDARRLLPVEMLVGISTHSREQALAASADLPDYIAIGPIYETKSKNNETLKGIGENTVANIYHDIDVPLVVIGGINPDRIKNLKGYGNCLYVCGFISVPGK